jgi:hypothetical protein
MNELEIFQAIYGLPLIIGMKVTIDPSNEYASEWQGEFLVTGINWERNQKRMNVTIAENWSDCGSDGWRTEDLRPVI